MRVGSGIGPATWAPVRLAVSTISAADVSSMRKSKALRRMRMRWPVMFVLVLLGLLIQDGGEHLRRHLFEVRGFHRVTRSPLGKRTDCRRITKHFGEW